MITQYEVSGSENCLKIKELALKQIELQQRCFDTQRTLPAMQARDSIMHMVQAYKSDVSRNYIFAAPDKSYAYFALFQTVGGLLIFDPQVSHEDIKAFGAVATNWDIAYPEAIRTQNLHNIAINGMKNERIVQYNNQQVIDASQVQESGIIDVALPDNKGTVRRLSELKGKVVLFDFHMFAMEDSPKRILALRELYNKFHDQGLEIYQLSLDGDEHFWKQQTAALPWICVRDPQGLNSNILVTYNVPAVPEYFLIDRQNSLVKRMAQISDLEAEIRKLL
jgi:peroxiredoxin